MRRIKKIAQDRVESDCSSPMLAYLDLPSQLVEGTYGCV